MRPRAQRLPRRSLTRPLDTMTQPPAPASPPTPPSTPTEPAEINIEDFAKVVLKTGRIVDAKAHPDADKLLVLTVSLGDQTRTICAGIRQWWAPEALIGKDVVIVANLKPRKMRGIESQGMLLAVSDGNDVIPLTAIKPVNPGLRVS
ncbi:MAG: hypothetical protein IT462_17915 [Planctomycetes bacterium]|nr:hypothetical protein [Planctomycetota bacterium]